LRASFLAITPDFDLKAFEPCVLDRPSPLPETDKVVSPDDLESSCEDTVFPSPTLPRGNGPHVPLLQHAKPLDGPVGHRSPEPNSQFFFFFLPPVEEASLPLKLCGCVSLILFCSSEFLPSAEVCLWGFGLAVFTDKKLQASR